MMALDKPLTSLAQDFKGLAEKITSEVNECMDLTTFALTCHRVSALFGYLENEFKFLELDFVAKVDDLLEASNSISTVPSLLDHDIGQKCVRQAGSHSRNLLRVMEALQAFKEFFELILVTKANNLEDLASMAYTRLLGDYHHEVVQTAAALAFYTLPTREDLWTKLNEDEASAAVQMKTFVDACTTITNYITKQFESKGLGIDW